MICIRRTSVFHTHNQLEVFIFCELSNNARKTKKNLCYDMKKLIRMQIVKELKRGLPQELKN